MDALANLPIDITRHRILDPTETAAFLGFTVSQLHRMKREGVIPPPILFSTRREGWRVDTLIKWLERREEDAFGGPYGYDHTQPWTQAGIKEVYARFLRERGAA